MYTPWLSRKSLWRAIFIHLHTKTWHKNFQQINNYLLVLTGSQWMAMVNVWAQGNNKLQIWTILILIRAEAATTDFICRHVTFQPQPPHIPPLHYCPLHMPMIIWQLFTMYSFLHTKHYTFSWNYHIGNEFMCVQAPLHMHKIYPKQTAHTKYENIKTRQKTLKSYIHIYMNISWLGRTLSSYISHTYEHTMTQLKPRRAIVTYIWTFCILWLSR